MGFAKRFTGLAVSFLLCFSMLPSAAFAYSADLTAASLTTLDESGELRPVSTADNPVEAQVIDPTEDGTTYPLYMQWSKDDSEGELGKYHWDTVTLSVYVDSQGIKYYFVTNPDHRVTDELFCTFVWVPESAKNGTMNIPGYVQLVSGDSEVGGICKVVQVGYSGGSQYKSETNSVDATKDQNKLNYWYAKNVGGTNDIAKDESGSNNSVTKQGSGSSYVSAVFIPKTMKRVGDAAFYQEETLKSVTFEEGSDQLKEIGYRAFGSCKSLESIDIPDSVTSIGPLKYFRVSVGSNGAVENYDAADTGKYATDSTGKTAVTDLTSRVSTGSGDGVVFENCAQLKYIHMPASLEFLGTTCFSGCTSLESFEYPKGLHTVMDIKSTDSSSKNILTGASVKKITFADGWSTEGDAIDKNWFSGTSLGSGTFGEIALPDGISKIGESAFASSTFTKVEVPASVTEIDTKAFYQCKNLESVEFIGESHLEKIGEQAFGTNEQLKSFTIPDSVTQVGNIVFTGCTSLQTVEVGSGLATMGGAMFRSCISLRSVVFKHPGSTTFSSFTLSSGKHQGVFHDAKKSPSEKLELYFVGENASLTDSDKATFTEGDNGGIFVSKSLTVYAQSDSIKNFFMVSDGTTNASNVSAKYQAGSSNPKGDVTVNYVTLKSGNMADQGMFSVASGGTYDGTAKEPKVTNSSPSLTEGTDYEVSYSDNVNAGEATATVKGLGSYFLSDPVELKFNIAPASIADASVAGISEQTATGAALEPAVSVTVKLGESETETALTADDFGVSYKNNTLPGTATVTLTGKGNFTGTQTATFSIVASADDKTAAATASATISEKLDTLPALAEITADDADAIASVEAALAAYDALSPVQKTQVDGATTSQLIAAQSKVAEVKQAAAEAAKTEAEAAQKTAEDAANEAAAAQKAAEDAKAASDEAAKKAADEAAEQKAAAEAAQNAAEAAQKEADAQKAAAEAAAAEAAQLKAELAKTAKTDLSSASVTVASATYTGKALTPAVTVKLGSTTLKQGTDYSVTYLNNKEGGTNTAAAVIVGKGSYVGALTKQFTIAAASNAITKPTSTKVSKSFKANKKTKKLPKAQTIALGAAKSKFGSAAWSLSAKDKKGALSLNTKTGKVTVKKGAKKGTYTLKAKASVAKTASWKAASRVVTVKVTVK